MIKGIVRPGNVAKKLSRAADIFEEHHKKAVREATLSIHATAIRNIQDNSDGPKQIRYGPKREVNVSKPGDYPNTDTGRLVASIKFEFSDDGARGAVGSNLKYAAYLEFVWDRPWLSLAVSEVDVAQIFEKWFDKAYKKVFS